VLSNIVFLNGASSSGKSAIAHCLQQVMEEFYVHTGIDHFLERVPLRFHAISDGSEPETPYGVLWVMPAGQPPVTELRFGPPGIRLVAGMYAAMAGLASAGNNVIVDDVIFDRIVLREALRALKAFDVLFVGVRCPLEVVIEREVARGDRMRGLAEAQHVIVHDHGTYDLEVDTSLLSSMECASLIKQRLQDGPRPTAFDALRRSLGD
jgi:chloramphenicol 3-O phosphotransferase